MTDTLYRWVKASERMPEKCGIENKVPVMYGASVCWGFRNFSEEKPQIYIETNTQSFLTTQCEWLEPYTPSPVSGSLEEAAQKYADEVCPFVWPTNKEGEKIEQRVGQNPPGSGKHRREQDRVKTAFIAGSAYVKKEEGIMIDLEGGFKDGDIVFAPKKKQKTQPSIFVYDSRIDYSTYYEGRFFRIKDSKPSRPSIDIVDELRKANPYIEPVREDETWNDCCDKLQELLNQKEAK